MSDFTKGGRGKQAPYKTTHCRVPEPVKHLVDQIIVVYKRLIDSPFDPGASKFISQIQESISKASLFESNDVNRFMTGIPQVGEYWYYQTPNMLRAAKVKIVSILQNGCYGWIEEETRAMSSATLNELWPIEQVEVKAVNNFKSYDEALELSKQLVKSKKSAKITVAKLLTAIYKVQTKPEDL